MFNPESENITIWQEMLFRDVLFWIGFLVDEGNILGDLQQEANIACKKPRCSKKDNLVQ
jgi:hypothetical protein